MRKTNYERGSAIPEYISIIVILVSLLVAFGILIYMTRPGFYQDLLTLKLDPNLPEVWVILVVAGGFFTGMKVTWSQLSIVIDMHAKQDIMELLSKGKSMNKDEINKVLSPKRIWYRLFRETLNHALLELTEKDKVRVKHEKYSLNSK